MLNWSNNSLSIFDLDIRYVRFHGRNRSFEYDTNFSELDLAAKIM